MEKLKLISMASLAGIAIAALPSFISLHSQNHLSLLLRILTPFSAHYTFIDKDSSYYQIV